MPCTSHEWEEIANHFLERWNVPNCIGAMDGRHICFCAPLAEGSYYRNYKGTNSIVLLGLVDAYYRFIYVNVGVNGRVSDGGVLRETDLNPLLHDPRNPLNIPSDRPLPGMTEPASYVILTDAAFETNKHILKPFPYRNLTYERRVYNYRMSRGRRIVENAFGILAAKWRVLLNPIYLPADEVQTITLACCALHNFLCSEHGAYLTGFFGLDENYSDQMDRHINNNQYQTNSNARRRMSGCRNREIFLEYFNTVGKVFWQDDMI